MAIYSDDFQSYAVASNPPYGSFTGSGIFSPFIVTSPAGPFGDAKCVQIPSFSNLSLNSVVRYPTISLFFPIQFSNWESQFVEILSDAVSILSLQSNLDGTISAFSGVTRIATSDISKYLDKWNWIQLNLTLTDVAGFLTIAVDIAFDQKVILSFVNATGISTGSLSSLGVNRFVFGPRVFFGRFTLDFIQPIGTDPAPGSPVNRITQAVIESVVVPDSANLRVTQGTIEVNVLPDSAKLRITQGLIELYVANRAAGSGGGQIYEA